VNNLKSDWQPFTGPASLESLLERIAIVACDQVGARYAAVGVLDEQGKLEQFIPIGMTPQDIELMDHPPTGKGLIGRLMHAHHSIRVPDISLDPRSAGFPPHHPLMQSFLGVPIRLGERQLGQIYLTNKTDAPEFSQDDELVIETLAAYAAVAISNARLYKELRERDRALTHRNENLALLNNLASTLASSPEIDEILETALQGVVEKMGVDVGEIFLREEDGRRLRLILHRGAIIDALFTRDTFMEGEGQIGLTASSGQPHLTTVTGKNGRYLKRAVHRACIRQVVTFPLTGRKGVLGVLCIATSHPAPYDDLEMQMLASIASWTGTAIENVSLNVQGRRLAILEERERIGMDLHDGIIQSIYAVGLTLEHARLLMSENKEQARKRIDMAIDDLNSTIRDIRTYILDLRPRQLKEENLIDGLQRLVTELRVNTLLDVNLKGTSEGIENLPDADAIALFHICQEALANVAKHSHARHVEIFLWHTDERVMLEIHDDGRGFDPQKMNLSLGHGISNMQTRAHNVGGEVEITSEPGVGSTILAWVPYSRNFHKPT
jgi:two-component system sensor histidine kinase DevS